MSVLLLVGIVPSQSQSPSSVSKFWRGSRAGVLWGEATDGERRKGNYDKVGTSLVAQTVKHLPIMQETEVRSQGQEDSLEKETATHSSILAWKTPWTEEPGGLQSMW